MHLLTDVFGRGCRWANNLITLQPKCKVDPILIENALCIFDAYCHAAQEQVSSTHRSCCFRSQSSVIMALSAHVEMLRRVLYHAQHHAIASLLCCLSSCCTA